MADHIYAFINELSFEGQFALGDVAKGLLSFLRSCNRIKDLVKHNYSILYMGAMYYKEISHGLSYASALKTITGESKDEVMRLKFNMDKSGWEKMEDSGFLFDANEHYSVGANDVSNSSLAEAYEYDDYVSGEEKVIVINMPMSSFGKTISVKKISENKTWVLNAMNSEDDIITYLVGNGYTMPYDRKSTMIPLPEQTILGDTTLFKKTRRRNMGAFLYERIGHNELWCVDTLHNDGSAHLEIFSKANDTWKGENEDLQILNPNYQSEKHKGEKIREK